MKKILITMMLLLLVVPFAVPSYAQCVAEIKNVVQDEIRGSIIVETEYVLNGQVVQQGKTRYLETSGTNAEIIAKAKEDIDIHCKNLVRRIDGNAAYLRAEKLKIQKALTAPVISAISGDLIGVKSKSITEVTDTYKGKDIKVTYDEKNSITNTP